MSSATSQRVAFIGGGNMASALIGGLVQSGHAPSAIQVVEPFQTQADKLRAQFGVQVEPAAGPALAGASLVVWAVKPQLFQQAARPCAEHVKGALQLSVMAGIRSAAITAATGSERVVRTMPNTPALIGRGMSGCSQAPSSRRPSARRSSSCWRPPVSCCGSSARSSSMR
jgi:pyrroline-5-carboxylate reductase